MFTRAINLVWRAVLALVALFGVLSLGRMPGWATLVWAGLAALTAFAPPTGLLIVAGLVPLGGALAWLFGPASWTEPLVVAFLAGAALRGAVRRNAGSPVVPAPAALLALAILSSCVVQLAVRRLRIGPGLFLDEMGRLLAGHYFANKLDFGALGAAPLFLEGLALFVVVRAIVRHHPDRLLGVARMMAAGAIGAAALNVSRLLSASIATGTSWAALPQFAGATRINLLYGDVNAAGSYFAMLLCVTVGLALSVRRAPRMLWLAGALIIALAVWLTGSRAAILALAAVGGVATVLSLLEHRQVRIALPRVLGGAALALALLLLVLLLPNRFTGAGTTIAVEVRRDMALVSFRLLAPQPVFGIGIGQFYEQSGDEMRRLPVGRLYIRENAHNNFLQILVELGVAGFALFGLVIWLSARSLWAADRLGTAARPATRALAAALGTFLLSALFGHPLLTPECAYAFWMLAGAAAAFGPAQPTGRLARYAALAACAVLVVSTPLRARGAMDDAYLEHLGYGLSLWETAADGQKYRVAERVATIFIPADAAVVQVPLRTSIDSAAALPVSVRLRGRLVDRLQVPGSSWTRYTFPVPAREHARFVPLELELEGAPGARLHIGKVVVVERRTK